MASRSKAEAKNILFKYARYSEVRIFLKKIISYSSLTFFVVVTNQIDNQFY